MKASETVCAWCGRHTICGQPVRVGKGAEEQFCCSAECAGKAVRYFRFVRRGIVAFALLILTAAGLVLSQALGFTGDHRFPMAGMLLLGVTILLFPFPTGWTVEHWGIRRSVWLCRILGVLAAGCSLLFLV